MAEHGGRLPDDLRALQALPGIGPYTARAVLAFAYESDEVGVLDTNAARVLARWEGRTLGRAEAQALADASVAPVGGLGVEPGDARPRRHPLPAPFAPLRRSARWPRGAPGSRPGAPSPIPPIGSAGVSTGQSVFAGSDRQGRGRLRRRAPRRPGRPRRPAAGHGLAR